MHKYSQEMVGTDYGRITSDAEYRRYIRPQQEAKNFIATLIAEWQKERDKNIELQKRIDELESEVEDD